MNNINMNLYEETENLLDEVYIKYGRFRGNGLITIDDALKGEFKRLNELGISKEDLINNGWDKTLDSETLLYAIKKIITKKYDIEEIKKENKKEIEKIINP